MAQSPDGTTVVTAAADETLRFWKILSGGEASKKERAAAKESILNSMSIRWDSLLDRSYVVWGGELKIRNMLCFWKVLSGGEASKKERAAAKESILNSMSIRWDSLLDRSFVV